MERKISGNIIPSNNSVRRSAFNRLYQRNTMYSNDIFARVAIEYNISEKVLKKYFNKKIQFSKHVTQVRKKTSNAQFVTQIRKEIRPITINAKKSIGTSGTGPRSPKI